MRRRPPRLCLADEAAAALIALSDTPELERADSSPAGGEAQGRAPADDFSPKILALARGFAGGPPPDFAKAERAGARHHQKPRNDALSRAWSGKHAVGDSDLPPAPVAGGSNTTASACNVVAKACEQIRSRIAQAAVAAANGALPGKDADRLVLTGGMLKDPDGGSEPLEAAIRRVSNDAIEVYAENTPHGVPPDGLSKLYQGHAVLAGGAKLKDRIQFAFGAEFVEVRVHARTREIRCPRVVGAFAAGRIIDPTTTKSQLMGGLIWGVSSALHEATEIDRPSARYYNTDLAEYLVPVNADIDEAEVILIPKEDHLVNDLGIKGLGELGNVGTNAAAPMPSIPRPA